MPLRFVCTAMIVAAMPLIAAAPALAEGLTLEIANDSAADILEFYASPVGADNWQANLLAEGPLAAGTRAAVAIATLSGCDYDFRMVFSDGDVLEQAANDICALTSYSVN